MRQATAAIIKNLASKNSNLKIYKIMTPTKKISFLIIVLLVNFLITSCGGCSKKKGNPLVREEKRLKNSLKEQCKPDDWKKLEETFEQDRTSTEKINQHIQRLLVLQEKVNNLEKLLTTIALKVSNNPLAAPEKQEVQSLLDLVSPLKQCPEELANKKLDELLKNKSSLKEKFIGLANPALTQLIKTFLTNQLDLWRNLKQQLELKSAEGTEGGDKDSN